MCGIVGLVAPGQQAAGIAALALFALQHRGQESAGVAVSDGSGDGVMVYKDLGLVSQVLDDRRLPSLRGHLAIAHCRYSTTGSTVWENSQPTFRLGPRRPVAIGHNGNLVNTRELLERLTGGGNRLVGSTDTELLTALLGAPPSARLVTAVQQRTDGLPFFVEELGAALRDEEGLVLQSGLLDAADDVVLPLPESVRDAVLARTAPKTPETLC